jgi:hypothetical protein
MAASLVVRVQADRLPDVETAGQPVMQIGLRVSAAVDTDSALPDTAAKLLDDILPWKWWQLGNPGVAWNPHDAAVWRLFRLDEQAGHWAATEIADATKADVGSPGVTPPDPIDPDAPDGFTDALTETLADICKAAGDAAICLPQGDAAIEHRTAYGMVETLSGLPHPVPAGMRVFTVLNVGQQVPPISDTTRFIAVPKFQPRSGGSHGIGAVAFLQDDLEETGKLRAEIQVSADAVAADLPWSEKLLFRLRPSLSWEEMGREVGSARLIDLRHYEIAADGPGDAGGIGDDDYAAHLPRRLAEAFDPAARLVSVFEDALAGWLADELPASSLPARLRDDLRFDAGTPSSKRSIVLEVLDRIAAKVVLPVAHSSGAADAVAVSLLGSLARQRRSDGARSDFAVQAGQMLLDLLDPAGGGTFRQAGDPLPPRSQFALFPLRCIAAAAGLPPEEALAANEAAALDSEAGFLAFVHRHWLGIGDSVAVQPRPLGAGASRVLEAQHMALDEHDELLATPQAALDARLLAKPGISFAMSALLDNAAATISLGTAVIVVLSRSGDTLTLEALGQTRTIKAGTAPRVITLYLDEAASELTVSLADEVAPSHEREIKAPAPTALLRQPFLITLSATDGDLADIRPVAASASLATQLSPTITAQGARSDLALACAGPFYADLLAGRMDWPVPVAADAGAPEAPGLAASMYGLAIWQYRKIWDEAVAATPGAEADAATDNIRDVLDALGERVIGRAALDARRLAEAAVPAGMSLDRLTMDAPPLVLRIDQLQGFGADVWGRLAGYGVLLGRSRNEGDEPAAWWTLNAARFHAGFDRAEPSKHVVVDIVDPVAVQVAEAGGVRQSLISYDNRWLATGLVDDPQMEGQDAADTPRRPEYLTAPQPVTNYPLPALSFGYTYHAVPYLIGHGGVLPVWLRAAAAAPLTRKGAPGKAILDGIGDIAKQARRKLYLRTRPIGAPRFVTAPGQPPVPPVREDVAPLAAELAIRPPPVTIVAGGVARFFRDANGQRGILSVEPAGEDDVPGLRVVFGEVHCGTAAGTMTVKLRGFRRTAMLEDIWSGKISVLGDLRLSLLLGNEPMVKVEKQDGVAADYFAEDERRFTAEVPKPAEAGEWRDIFIEVTAAGQAVEFEPPVVTAIRHDPGTVGPVVDKPPSPITRDFGKPQIAPESSHRSRLIALIDGISKNKAPALTLTLRRPGVEFGTFERWVNPALIEGARPIRDKVAAALNRAHALATSDPPDGVTQRDVSFEDPSVTRFYLELVRVFPFHEPVAALLTDEIDGDLVFVGDGAAGGGGMRPTITTRVSEDVTDKVGLMTRPDGYVATLAAGEIYELRSYAVLSPTRQAFSPFETLDRLSPSVSATLRCIQHGKSAYWLSSPVVITLEVATAVLPQAYDVPAESKVNGALQLAQDPNVFALDRVPMVREDAMRIFLPSGLAGPSQYPATRYVGTAALHAQRWSWRGRPQPEIALTAGQELNGESVHALAELAFVDRRDGDIGEVMVRRVEHAHVYAGRKQLKGINQSSRTALFNKPLDWRGGLNLWRFGLSLTSRYAAMFLPRTPSTTFAHLPPVGTQTSKAKWSVAAVLDRPGTGRVAGRPGLALVLPLTEPLMTGGATPPLLALFNDRLYANFNMADAIEVAVEVARHPYTLSDQYKRLEALPGLVDDNDKYIDKLRQKITELMGPPPPTAEQEEELRALEDDLEIALGRAIELPRELAALQVYLAGTDKPSADTLKHWQEYGPDPIRTGAAHDGQPVLLRTDGPVGYTFDVGTEAGRFDHAGLLISPVRQQVEPWSMIKLRFRRLEAPEGLAGGVPQEVDNIDHILTHRASAAPKPAAKVLAARQTTVENRFEALDFEGLVLDLALDRASLVETTLTFDLVKGGAQADVDSTNVKVRIVQTKEQLTIGMSTTLGPAGDVQLPLGSSERATLRFVVSAREKPADAEKWIPTGDVAIKLRIDGGDADGLERPDRERWLAVNALPIRAIVPAPLPPEEQALIAQGKATVDDELSLRLRRDDTLAKPKLMLRPVRLSGFTPPVWCQFAEAMSGLDAVVRGSTGLRRISIDELAVTARTKSDKDPTLVGLDLALRRPIEDRAEPPPLVSLAPLSRTDASSQLDEILVAVVTRYVSDAFARLRERPVALVHLSDASGVPVSAPPETSLRVPIEANHPDLAWWDEAGAPSAANGGRLRFMRLLVPKSKDRGGFASAPVARNLASLFGAVADSSDLNPADAGGLILGMSRPVEWAAPDQ